MCRGAPGKWSGLHPTEPGGLLKSLRPIGGGAPPRLFPQRAPKTDAKAPAPPKARRGAAGNGPQEDLGEGGAPGPPKADPARPAPSTMPSAPLHPRAARPAPACALLLLPPGAHRRAAAAQGPAASSLRAAPRPGREVSGFRPPSPASLLPPAARGPRTRSKAEEL